MAWNEVTTDGMLVVELSGEIDLHSSPQLREQLRAKAQNSPPALLLDMSRVKYIDSSGLATLVEYYQRARAFSGRIALAGLTPRVKSIFDLVRLSEVFPIYATVDEAKAALRGVAPPG